MQNLNITAVLWLQCWWLLQCHETVEREPVSPNRTTALCCRWQCEQQAYDIGKANPCSQKRPCFCLLEGWSSYKLSPFYFYFFLFFFFSGLCGWSWGKHRESSESWTRFWLSLKAGKWSKGNLGVLYQLGYLFSRYPECPVSSGCKKKMNPLVLETAELINVKVARRAEQW